jgi:hypothetical protein
MAAMIGYKDEWPVRRQLLTADDCEPMCDREVNSDQGKTSMMSEAFEETALAPHTLEPFSRR